MKKLILLAVILIPIIAFSQKTFNSNGVMETYSEDSDWFGFFDKYERLECSFSLYPDRVIINDEEVKIKKLISESGVFSKTLHVALDPNRVNSNRMFSSVDLYGNRCTEIIVEYTEYGEIEWIKTKHFQSTLSGGKNYYWRKHAVTSNFKTVKKHVKEEEKIDW